MWREHLLLGPHTGKIEQQFLHFQVQICGVVWQIMAPLVRQLSEGQLVQPSGTWLNDDSICVLACLDGIRPVTFLLEAEE